MRSHTEVVEKLKPYVGPVLHYKEGIGYIAWQESTGNNVELLFIEVAEPGKGHATELVREMCRNIKPFNSVFVFRLEANETAGHFYRKLGFKETRVEGLYKVPAVLGVVNYEELCRNLSIS